MIQLGLIGFPIEHSLSPDLYHGFMEVSETKIELVEVKLTPVD